MTERMFTANSSEIQHRNTSDWSTASLFKLTNTFICNQSAFSLKTRGTKWPQSIFHLELFLGTTTRKDSVEVCNLYEADDLMFPVNYAFISISMIFPTN